MDRNAIEEVFQHGDYLRVGWTLPEERWGGWVWFVGG